ncbi:MAG: hypothetical protein U9N31_06760 [Candidatus Marinimicrobia bacterium]|nr:hypothetical protein [Candidatus Neomarinimicrobiota bacterium]
MSGATVITMEKGNPRVEAVAIKESKIVGVGNLKLLKRQFKGAEVVNHFTEKVIMPGFIENHIHPSLAAILLPMDFITPFEWDLPNQQVTDTHGRDAFLKKLTDNVKNSKKDEW